MAFSVSARTAAQDPRAPEVPAARIPGQPGPFKRYEPLFVGGVSVFVFVAVWQLAAVNLFCCTRLVQCAPGDANILH